MSALSLMTCSKEAHPAMLETELTDQRGAYRWYSVEFPNVSLKMLQTVMALYRNNGDYTDSPISGARIDDDGVELMGSFPITPTAIAVLREMNAALTV